MNIEQLLGQFPNYANDALIITEAASPDGTDPRIVYVNPAFSRLTGYSAAEMAGQTPCLLHGPQTEAEAVARIRQAWRERKPVVVELACHSKEGRAYWVETSVIPVMNEHGECTYFISIEKDITERRAMQEATSSFIDMERLSLFLDGPPEEREELRQLFLSQSELSMEKLRAAYIDGDGAKWKAAAHEFKGASASLGATALAEICAQAEQSANAPAHEKHQLLQSLSAAVNQLNHFMDGI